MKHFVIIVNGWKHFVIIVNGWKLLTIITKNFILDIATVLDPSPNSSSLTPLTLKRI